MLRPIVIVTCAALTVTGCARIAESRLNPFNWFGRSQVVETVPTETRPLVKAGDMIITVDNRVLIDTITEMEVAKTGSGAILRATGVAPSQGYHNAELVLESVEGSRVTYAFRVEAPTDFQIMGTTASRTITVARDIPAAELAAMGEIVVRGAQNARASRR